jgi:hypothetical protein
MYIRIYLSAEQVRIDDRQILASHMDRRGQPYRTREAHEWATVISDGEIGEDKQHRAPAVETWKMKASRLFLFLCAYVCLGLLYELGSRASHLLPLL